MGKKLSLAQLLIQQEPDLLETKSLYLFYFIFFYYE